MQVTMESFQLLNFYNRRQKPKTIKFTSNSILMFSRRQSVAVSCCKTSGFSVRFDNGQSAYIIDEIDQKVLVSKSYAADVKLGNVVIELNNIHIDEYVKQSELDRMLQTNVSTVKTLTVQELDAHYGREPKKDQTGLT